MEVASKEFMKRLLHIFFLVILLIFIPSRIFAQQSGYVLPYPSFMPGNKLYVVDKIFDRLKQYWYFGNFSQVEYNLKQSDKYLVEAKTLFEYKQFLLASNSLKQSDTFFKNILPQLLKAEKNGKNIKDKKILLQNAAKKHIEVLEEIKKSTPEVFEWSPEKERPTHLNLHNEIRNAIMIRNSLL